MVTLEHKKQLREKFDVNFAKHKSLVMVETNNIDNNMLKNIMDSLITQHGGVFLHGRKRSLAKSCSESDDATMQKLAQKLTGNIVIYFHNSSCAKVVTKIEEFVKYGAAKYGQASLVDFEVPAQQTKIPPDGTKYFQRLRMPTKLTRGTIEITNNFMVLEKGKTVTQAQIDVLSALKLLPYSYRLRVTSVFTNGELVDPEIYRTPVDLISQLSTAAIGKALRLSHGACFPTKPVSDAKTSSVLTQALALALELSDKVEPPVEFQEKIALLKDPEAMEKLKASAAAAAPVAESAAPAEAAAAPAAEESSEEASEMDLDF